MHCDDLGPRMLEYLAGTLPDDELAAIRAHLTQCATCRDEMDATAELWGELGAVPAPRPESARMRARFDAALQGYIDGQSEPAARAVMRQPSVWLQPWVQFAGAAAVLVMGVALGRFVIQPQSSNPEIALLRQELRDTRQMVTLSLLTQQSASERLKGVSFTSQIDQPGGEVTLALLDTLMHDPNVNVRLATIDALKRFAGGENVRRGVLEALARQTSPLVQIALIDYVVETNDRGAADTLRRLSSDPMLDQAVRGRATQALQQIG